MFKDNEALLALKKELAPETKPATGTVKSHQKGFGFLNIEDGESIFITAENMKRLRDGDIVSGEVQTRGDKSDFVPKKMIQEAPSVFLAFVKKTSDKFCFVESESKNDSQWHFLSPKFAGDLDVGDLILVDLVGHPFNGKSRVNLLEIVSKNDDPRLPWKHSFAKHGIDTSELTGFDRSSFDVAFSGGERVNMKDKHFITIDGESTSDMDDAIYVEQDGENLAVYVAIADPTEVVTPDSKWFDIAKERAYTTYTPGWKIPMLPRAMTDELFSLKAHEAKPVLACKIIVDKHGRHLSKEFFEAFISSKGKLAYNNVSDWLEGKESHWAPESKEQEKVIELLHEFYKRRLSYRTENQLVFPDTPDFSFKVENWKAVDVFVEHRRTGNKIVEEAMILANVCFAEFLNENNLMGMFKRNIGLDPELIDDAMPIVSKVIPEMTKEEALTLPGYIRLRKALDEKVFSKEDMQIRSLQAKTEFSSTPTPHYGLGVEMYATWTSPLRKVEDLVNHMSAKAFLRGQSLDSDVFLSLLQDEFFESVIESMVAQRRVERTIKDKLHLEYLESLGKTQLNGKVVYLSTGGISIELEKTGHSIFVSKLALATRDNPLEVNTAEGFVESKLVGRIDLGSTVKVSIENVIPSKEKVFCHIAKLP